jgi:hypothetical protein
MLNHCQRGVALFKPVNNIFIQRLLRGNMNSIKIEDRDYALWLLLTEVLNELLDASTP